MKNKKWSLGRKENPVFNGRGYAICFRKDYRQKCTSYIRNLLVAGKITKEPCTKCGSTIKIEAHHDDYSNPDKIIWLCRKHHWERHRFLRKNDLSPWKNTEFNKGRP